jgi:hypothetical protein
VDEKLIQEVLDRMHHFYLQIDGSMKWPNSAEGDLLRMVYKAVSGERLISRKIHCLKYFTDNHCVGKQYDSCKDSACAYSSLGSGCTHPLHLKNVNH